VGFLTAVALAKAASRAEVVRATTAIRGDKSASSPTKSRNARRAVPYRSRSDCIEASPTPGHLPVGWAQSLPGRDGHRAICQASLRRLGHTIFAANGRRRAVSIAARPHPVGFAHAHCSQYHGKRDSYAVSV